MLGGAHLLFLATGEACFALSRSAPFHLDAGEACFGLTRSASFHLAAGEACFGLTRSASFHLAAGEACFALSRFVRRLCRVLVAFSVAAVVLTLATHALADFSVLLVVDGAVDQDTAPYELRLRSEFAAEGLEVVTASGRSQQNLLDLEGLARKTGAVAALSVFVNAQEVQGRLWVSDPSSNADLVRTLHVTRSEGDPVSVFALRAVEALRGARLELEQQRRRMVASGAGEPGGNAPATTGTNANPASANTPATNGPVPPKTNPKPPIVKPPAPKALPKPIPAPPKPARPVAMRWTLLGSVIPGYDHNGLGQIWAPALDARYRLFDKLSMGLAFDGPFISSHQVKGRRSQSESGTRRHPSPLYRLAGQPVRVRRHLSDRPESLRGIWHANGRGGHWPQRPLARLDVWRRSRHTG